MLVVDLDLEAPGLGSLLSADVSHYPRNDADARIAPRSFLRLIALSAERSLVDPRGVGPLLDPTSLVDALQSSSRARVNEEYPSVARLEGSQGKTMLLPRRIVESALARSAGADDRSGRTLPRCSTSCSGSPRDRSLDGLERGALARRSRRAPPTV